MPKLEFIIHVFMVKLQIKTKSNYMCMLFVTYKSYLINLFNWKYISIFVFSYCVLKYFNLLTIIIFSILIILSNDF